MTRTIHRILGSFAIILFVAGIVFAGAPLRPEYPRPEMTRTDWMNLNGEWRFALDLSDSGEERGLPGGLGFDRMINVPFAPESPLSGVGFADFIPAAWYQKSFVVPDAWRGKRLLLHFEACDYASTVWVNGRVAGGHEGGYTPFALDITRFIGPGENSIVLRARDDTRSGAQPTGKQSHRYSSYNCVYRRTTGIWQTVWLEPVAGTFIEKYKVNPDIDNASVGITVFLNRPPEAGTIRLRVSDGGKVLSETSRKAGGIVDFQVPIRNPKLWGIRQPNLYELEISFEKNKTVEDKVGGYFGMRKIETRGNRIFLNNKSVFMRTVLDQGFYPDGIYTAPSDEALRRDIELSMGMGFDGARLHQRVFERRFLYWADKLGYMVWGEFADWGLSIDRSESFIVLAREWSESVTRDINHPSVIGWCPLNERWNGDFPGVITGLFDLTKRLDPTRLVIGASGGYHRSSPDVYDSHNYDQNPETFKKTYDGLLEAPQVVFVNEERDQHVSYSGQPYFVSEYGGIWWNPGQKDDKAWGYGDRPKTVEEFLDRYKRLTEALLANRAVAGFCYTQLTDVEQEVNGLMTFDRKPKADPEYFRKINQQPAAIERE
jgi:beta-galactosidase/beta-glucuronidase